MGAGGFWIENWLIAEVNFPASLRFIGDYAFDHNTGLRRLFFAGPQPTIGNDILIRTRGGIEVVYAYDQPGWDVPSTWGYRAHPSRHNVTFMNGNEIIKVESVARNGNATPPPESPSREGYIFFGWDTPLDNVRSHLTVRPVWRGVIVHVTFIVDGAIFESREIERGVRTRTPALPPPVVTGETRVWATDDRAIRLRQGVSFVVIDDIILHAVREPCAHTTACVTCAGRGGTMPTTISCGPCGGTAICLACDGVGRSIAPSVPCETCSATGLGTGSPIPVLHGDVNGDGQIDIIDLTLLRLHIAGQIPAADIYAGNADINISGAVDLDDAALLRRLLAGLP